MIIEVTEKHIKKGIRKNRQKCPIALAFKDKFGEDCDAQITPIRFGSFINNVHKCGIVSEELTQYILTFDRGKEIKPTAIKIVKNPDRTLVLKKIGKEK